MHVELKTSRDFLHMQLRRLLRDAKKAELELHCLVEGSFDRSINLSQAGLGPYTRQRKERLWLYVRKAHHWSKVHLQIHPSLELDCPKIMSELKNLVGQHHLPPSKDDRQNLHLTAPSDDNVDVELINLDFKESADFFRSRFLIDAPKKILFEARVSTGCNYQAYASEEVSMVFQPYSHFGIDAWLRTKTAQVQLVTHGQNLRDMRLSVIRPLLCPFWNAPTIDPSGESLPSEVIFSSTCLFSLAHAALKSQKDGNIGLWNWLKTWHGEGTYPLGLQPKACDNYSPLSQVLLGALERKIHPPGEIEHHLSEYLKTQIPGQRLYIQDVVVDIDGPNIWLTTKGSSLLLNQGRTGLINSPLSFSLTGEKIQEASCSKSLTSSLGFDHTPLLVPEYAIFRELQVQLRCGQPQ
jgi:hypothetical protein